MRFQLDARNLDKVHSDLRRVIQLMTPAQLASVNAGMGSDAIRAVRELTHVRTGTLRDSHRLASGPEGAFLYIDRSAFNEESNKFAIEYAGEEIARGGTHDFYQQLMDQHGERILRDGALALIRELPK